MKKIRSITQLELKQAKLKLKEVDLERSIRKNWKEVKQSLELKNIGQQILSELIGKKLKEKFSSKNIIAEGLSFGASFLSKKLGEKFKIFSRN